MSYLCFGVSFHCKGKNRPIFRQFFGGAEKLAKGWPDFFFENSNNIFCSDDGYSNNMQDDMDADVAPQRSLEVLESDTPDEIRRKKLANLMGVPGLEMPKTGI